MDWEIQDTYIGLNCAKMLIKSRKYNKPTSYSCDLDAKNNLKNWIQINKRQIFIKSARAHSKSNSFSAQTEKKQIHPKNTAIMFPFGSTPRKLTFQKSHSTQTSSSHQSNLHKSQTSSPTKHRTIRNPLFFNSLQNANNLILHNKTIKTKNMIMQKQKQKQKQKKTCTGVNGCRMNLNVNQIKGLKDKRLYFTFTGVKQDEGELLFVKGNSML